MKFWCKNYIQVLKECSFWQFHNNKKLICCLGWYMKSEWKAGNQYFSVSYVFMWTRLIWHYILCNMFQWVSFFSSMLSVLGVCVNVFRFFVFHCHRFFLCNLVASLLSGVCVFCGFAFACQVCFEEGSKCTIISESCASVVIRIVE